MVLWREEKFIMSKRWLSRLIALAAAGVALSGCSFLTAEASQPVVEVVESDAFAPTSYANPDALVDTAWVHEHLDDRQVRLVDVSTEPEVYAEGHLPGASYVNLFEDLTSASDPVRGQILSGEELSELLSGLGIANDDTVVLYDDRASLFATRAYWVLKYYQHDDVRIYNGGSAQWVDAGHELTIAEPDITPTDYVAGAPDPAIRTTWDDVVSSLDDPSTLFCDTRGLAEYTGLDARSERGGHIPGAINVDWAEAVSDDGTFLPADELYAVYREAGFAPDQQVITYCQTGVRGAHTWFVLRELLGYPDVRNYDGSWEEYGNNPDSLIER
jgi:thiosulfate/3-mercaptopyruvate sulfurtransferase